MNVASNVNRLTTPEKLAVLCWLSYPHTPLKFKCLEKDKWLLSGEGLPMFSVYTLNEAVIAAITYVYRHYREWKKQKQLGGHRWREILLDIDTVLDIDGIDDASWLDEPRCCLKIIPRKHTGKSRGRYHRR